MLIPMTEKQFTHSLVVKCASLEVTVKELEKQITKLEWIIEYGLDEKDLEQDV